MKKPLFLIIFLISIYNISAQNISGTVVTEGVPLAKVLVININKEAKAQTDAQGNFEIAASVGDELRFTKKGYERSVVKISAENSKIFADLVPKIQEIEEVEITFKPTGNLGKDALSLDVPKKVSALNTEMSAYMKVEPKESYPVNKVPSAFNKNVDFFSGSLDFIALAGALIGVGKKIANPKTTANYAEREAFYKRIKQSVNLEKYKKYGLSDYDIDRFLAYVDNQSNLSKNYRHNFNPTEIDMHMMESLKKFLQTQNKISED